MSMSMMKRTAPLTLLYCGSKHVGSNVGFKVPAVQTLCQKGEEEVDGYTEEVDECTVKAVGMTELGARLESRLQLQDSGYEEHILPELEKESRDLLSEFYRCHTGLPHSAGNKRHGAVSSLQRVVGNVLHKHRMVYNGMVQRLFDQANGLESVSSVLRGVFSDGVMSWGRIASVLALGAVVCERLKEDRVKEDVEECVDVVASHISTYIVTELQYWFINNNGWDGFVDFFRAEDPESRVRNALMAVAGLGIGVCLISLMR